MIAPSSRKALRDVIGFGNFECVAEVQGDGLRRLDARVFRVGRSGNRRLDQVSLHQCQPVGGRLADLFQIRDRSLHRRILGLFNQQVAVTDDVIHRRTQLVVKLMQIALLEELFLVEIRARSAPAIPGRRCGCGADLRDAFPGLAPPPCNISQ